MARLKTCSLLLKFANPDHVEILNDIDIHLRIYNFKFGKRKLWETENMFITSISNYTSSRDYK